MISSRTAVTTQQISTKITDHAFKVVLKNEKVKNITSQEKLKHAYHSQYCSINNTGRRICKGTLNGITIHCFAAKVQINTTFSMLIQETGNQLSNRNNLEMLYVQVNSPHHFLSFWMQNDQNLHRLSAVA